MKFLLILFSAVLLVSWTLAQSKIAFEVEFAVITQIYDVKNKIGYLSAGDDRLNFAKPNSWIVSMDNAKGRGTFPSKLDMPKVLKHTGLTKLERDDKCKKISSHCQGNLEVKTDKTIEITLENLKKQKTDLLDIRKFIAKGCNDDTHIAFYKEGETLFFCYPRCESNIKATKLGFATKPTEAQITVNVKIDAFLDPKSALVSGAVKSMLKDANNIDKWKKNAALVKWLSGKSKDCITAVEVALLFSDYWIIKGGQQKQSINPLPKVGLCDLWAHAKGACGKWDGKIDGKFLGEVLDLGSIAGGALLSNLMNNDVDDCKEWNAFNAHAGTFPLGSSGGKTTLAIEVRKADSEVLAQYVVNPDAEDGSITDELKKLQADT